MCWRGALDFSRRLRVSLERVRSRRFAEHRTKAKKGTYLKMLLSVQWIAEWVVSCRVCHGC